MTYLQLSVSALLVAFFALAAVACDQGKRGVTVQLLEQESSGQSGTATLTAIDAQTEVVLQVVLGPPEDDPQPVHIHFGSCGPNLGEVAIPLQDLVAGKSTTLVDASLSTLTDGNHNINLHESYPEVSIYTSCGEIPSD